ncbi:cell division protein SepF [Acidimicrobiia bacterium EGI L10123]|uniref:cell division protein SepF n=1 Tax=Salinilacustrithrix flava TaxID=2957203 RepID=UPI003D7C2CAA|nr:cell division protein SepF [Acidimicrobiia bacterium EGI L10123]
MAGVFQKAMVWLGLAPDEEYDDYRYDDAARPAPGGPTRQGGGWGGQQGPGGPRVHQPPPEPEEPVGSYGRGQGGRPTGAVRPLPPRGQAEAPARAPQREETPTVRPMRPTSAKPTVVTPTSFDAAKDVADRFKANQPVVMDLSDADRDLARRLIDFSSGMCYALGGNMERVTPGVYLITPSGVEVSAEERRRLAGGR